MSMIKFLDIFLIKIQEGILIISNIAICLLIFAAAFSRYILQIDFYGSEEIIMLVTFWLYFFGSSLAERFDTHIRADMVDILIKNQKIKNFLFVCRFIISITVAIIITYWSYNFIERSFMLNPKSPVLKLPLIFTQIPILISFVLMDIYLIRNFIASYIKTEKRG